MGSAGRPPVLVSARQQRLAQRSRRSRHYERALRRRQRTAAAAGDRAGHRRLEIVAGARHRLLRLPSQRRPCGIRRFGARACAHEGNRQLLRRSAARHTRRQSVHDAHARRGGLRPVRPRAVRPVLPRLCRRARRRPRDTARARAARARRYARAVQHGVSRRPRLGRRKRREPAPRRGQPAHLRAAVPALAGKRGARGLRHERRPHADLGLGRRRRGLDRSLRPRALARHARESRDRTARHRRRDAVALPLRLPPRARRNGRPPARTAGPAPRRRCRGGREPRPPARPRCPDARLRAPLRRVQAHEPAARGPGTARAPAQRPRPARAARHRRQGASARRGGPAPDPRMAGLSAAARCPWPRGLRRGLRSHGGRRADARRRRSGSTRRAARGRPAARAA